MIQPGNYGVRELSTKLSPYVPSADYLKNRETHEMAEFDLSAQSATGNKLGLIIDFTTGTLALRVESPVDETGALVPMKAPAEDWREHTPPPGHAEKEWQEKYEAAQRRKTETPAPLVVPDPMVQA